MELASKILHTTLRICRLDGVTIPMILRLHGEAQQVHQECRPPCRLLGTASLESPQRHGRVLSSSNDSRLSTSRIRIIKEPNR